MVFAHSCAEWICVEAAVTRLRRRQALPVQKEVILQVFILEKEGIQRVSKDEVVHLVSNQNTTMKSRSGLRKLLSSKICNCCKNISSDMWNSALTQLQFKTIERSRRSACTTSARHIAQMTIRMTRVTPRKIEMLKKITIEKR